MCRGRHGSPELLCGSASVHLCLCTITAPLCHSTPLKGVCQIICCFIVAFPLENPMIPMARPPVSSGASCIWKDNFQETRDATIGALALGSAWGLGVIAFAQPAAATPRHEGRQQPDKLPSQPQEAGILARQLLWLKKKMKRFKASTSSCFWVHLTAAQTSKPLLKAEWLH